MRDQYKVWAAEKVSQRLDAGEEFTQDATPEADLVAQMHKDFISGLEEVKTTIRELVREKLGNLLEDFLRKSHERNYEHLLVDASGDVWFSQSIDQTYWGNYSSLGRAGTGSVPCNCDWCQGPEAVDSPSDIQFESDEYQLALEEMTRRLDEISVGYFNDEN